MKFEPKKYLPIIVLFFIFNISFYSCSNKTIKNKETVENESKESGKELNQTSKILLVTGEYPPYTSEKINGYGFFTQIVEAVLKDANLKYELKFYPWARGLDMTANGTAWATFPYGHAKDFDKTYFTTDGIFSSTHKFIYLLNNPKIKAEVQKFQQISDFKDYTFGGTDGYWYGSEEDFQKQNVNIEWTTDLEGIINMLLSKRIDFFIEDEAVFNYTINNSYPEDRNKFDFLENDAQKRDYLLLVSKSYPNTNLILKKFNKSLKKILSNGVFDAILKKYNINN